MSRVRSGISVIDPDFVLDAIEDFVAETERIWSGERPAGWPPARMLVRNYYMIQGMFHVLVLARVTGQLNDDQITRARDLDMRSEKLNRLAEWNAAPTTASQQTTEDQKESPR